MINFDARGWVEEESRQCATVLQEALGDTSQARPRSCCLLAVALALADMAILGADVPDALLDSVGAWVDSQDVPVASECCDGWSEESILALTFLCSLRYAGRDVHNWEDHASYPRLAAMAKECWTVMLGQSARQESFVACPSFGELFSEAVTGWGRGPDPSIVWQIVEEQRELLQKQLLDGEYLGGVGDELRLRIPRGESEVQAMARRIIIVGFLRRVLCPTGPASPAGER